MPRPAVADADAPAPRRRPRRRAAHGADRGAGAPPATGGTGDASRTPVEQHAAADRLALVVVVVVVGGVLISRRRAAAAVARTSSRTRRDAMLTGRPRPRPAREPMGSRYCPRRLGQAIVTIVLIVLLNFVLFRMMPGLAGAGVRATRTSRRDRSPRTGHAGASTSRSSPNQLVALHRVDAQGDLGYSFKYRGQPVDRGHRRRVWPTIILFGLGEVDRDRRRARASAPIRAGDAAAPVDYGRATALSLILYSMPYFVIGMMLLVIFAAGLAGSRHRACSRSAAYDDARRPAPRFRRATSCCR